MSTLKTLYAGLLTDWHFMRWLRLALGAYVMVQAVQMHDGLAGLIAFFFLYQAVTNTGCCGAGGCSIPAPRNEGRNHQEAEFEEVLDSDKKTS